MIEIKKFMDESDLDDESFRGSQESYNSSQDESFRNSEASYSSN